MKHTLLFICIIICNSSLSFAQCEANAGTDVFTCQEAVQTNMNAEMPPEGAVGTWSIISDNGTFSFCDLHSPKTSISDFDPQVYTLLWTVECQGNLLSADTAQVYVYTASMMPANAGPDMDITTPQSMVQLQGNIVMPPADGQWSLVSGPNIPYFTDINSHNTFVANLVIGMYQFKWSILGNSCYNGSIDDIVQVTVFQAGSLPFFVGAGQDQYLCGFDANTNLGAFPLTSPASGQWSIIAGSGTILNVTSPFALVSNLPIGQNTFVWTVNDGQGNISSDTTNVFVHNTGPMDFLGPDFSLCSNFPFTDLSLNVPENGLWSGDCVSAQGLFTAVSPGEYNIHLEYTNLPGNCVAFDDITISNAAVSNSLICGQSITTSNTISQCGKSLVVPTPQVAGGLELISIVNDFNGTDNASGFYPSGSSVVTWTAEFESCTATCQQSILVIDNEAPFINCAGTISLLTETDLCTSSMVELEQPVVSDNCGISSLTNNGTTIFNMGITSVIWTATDNSGNTTSCIQNIMVIDNQPPVFACLDNDTLLLSANCEVIVPDYSLQILATDNCDMSAMTYNQYPLAGTILNGPQEITVNFTATDGSGNSSNCSFQLVATGTCPSPFSIEDLAALLGVFGCVGTPECLQYDLNGDGMVNVQDLLIMMSFIN